MSFHEKMGNANSLNLTESEINELIDNNANFNFKEIANKLCCETGFNKGFDVRDSMLKTLTYKQELINKAKLTE